MMPARGAIAVVAFSLIVVHAGCAKQDDRGTASAPSLPAQMSPSSVSATECVLECGADRRCAHDKRSDAYYCTRESIEAPSRCSFTCAPHEVCKVWDGAASRQADCFLPCGRDDDCPVGQFCQCSSHGEGCSVWVGHAPSDVCLSNPLAGLKLQPPADGIEK